MTLSADQHRVLVIEDEVAIAQLLKIQLSELDLLVDVVHDAESGLRQLGSTSYSICLLDWMLPGLQGIDFLKNVQNWKGRLKIMMLTAKSDPDARMFVRCFLRQTCTTMS